MDGSLFATGGDEEERAEWGGLLLCLRQTDGRSFPATIKTSLFSHEEIDSPTQHFCS